MEDTELGHAVERLAQFLGHAPLTGVLAALENSLVGADAAAAAGATAAARLEREVLLAALTARRSLGRINDLIHAAAIALVLPHLLEDGEQVSQRPSLAAGNDATRPFDLETTHRVAEFKLAHWSGADAMRKRPVFKDLVNLAAEQSSRRKQLFVVGHQPAQFLQTSISKAGWALDRFPAVQRTFERRFGTLDMAIAQFTATNGEAVEIIDLTTMLPELMPPSS